jgi:endo-1,4-beta-xylanase
MFNIAGNKMNNLVCFFFLVLITPAMSIFGQTAVVENGFEKGVEKWEARGDRVSISSSKDQFESGEKSLKVSGRSAFWQGAQLNIIKLLSPGKIYKFTASVKLGKNEKPDNLKMTIQHGSGGGEGSYDNLSALQANSDEWKTLSGNFKPNGSDGYILVYFEADRANTSFFLDNFKIELAGDGTPKQSGVILQNDFEDLSAQNWGVRGDNVDMFSSNAGGSQSLKVTSRTQNWHGLQLDVSPLMFKGRTYQISVSARLLKGQKSDSLKVSMQETPPKGEAKYTEITTPKTVTDAEWTTLTGQYTATTTDNNLLLYVEAAGPTTSFFIDNFVIQIPGTTASTDTPKPKVVATAETNIPSLYKSLADYFPVGVAIWKGDLEGEHAVLVKKHFNSITSENDMKFESIQPSEGNFTFDAADAQVSFAKANGMKIRGHTLCWHDQTPPWVFKDAKGNLMTPTPENKALLLKRLENHIRTVVKHFGNDVFAWDVVNEVVDETQPDGFRRDEWFKITGTDYIKTAFRVARESNPNAKLYINDFSTTDPKKRKFLYDLIVDLQKQGVPIDGIGHQMHINIDYPSKELIVETINLFNGLKIDNQITELDISIYKDYDAKTGFPDYQSIDKAMIIKQGYKYREVFDAFKSLKGKISSVTFWSHSDDHTWMTKPNKVDAPLPFDTSLKSKPAFWGIVDPTKLPAM